MVHTEAIKIYPLAMQLLIKKIYHRTQNGKNAIIGVFGQTGSGKSLTVLQLMRGLYLYKTGEEPPEEEIIERVYFRANHFVKKMNDISNGLHENKKALDVGNSYLWDETGVDAGNKESQTLKNRVINFLVQTFRNLRQIIFLTTPSFSFIDKGVRKLIHFYIHVERINYMKKVAYIKVFKIQYNDRLDKVYHHSLRYTQKKGIIKFSIISIPKVSDSLEDLYENKKNEFTNELNMEILDKLEAVSNNKTLNPISYKHIPYFKAYHEFDGDSFKMSEALGVTKSAVYQCLRNMDKFYGYEWRENPNYLGNSTIAGKLTLQKRKTS